LNTIWRNIILSQRLQSRAMTKITFGKYILDSLSIGMYSDPLMALREYIQNSTDSMDYLPKDTPQPVVEITVDGRNRSLEISDSGVGIPSRKVKSTLLNIGASEKDPINSRGFRGIGRLGGLGYCDTLVFITKSRGERTYTSCIWDSKLLRQLIDNRRSIDTCLLIEKATSVKSSSYSGPEKDHFFKVQMLNIHDSRNDLLNVPLIRSYLSQMAPVPFRPDFVFGTKIDRALSKHVPAYKNYKIVLNKEQIFKQYRSTVNLCRDSIDRIKDIQFIELHADTSMLAFGWLGNLNLFGAINPASGVDGIRLRCGNILLGNKDTLSVLFKEPRFNHYLVGELHTVDKRLIPNSRRDDFEDSAIRGNLFNEFIKEIGIPFSSKIRALSMERGKAKERDNIGTLFKQASAVINHGYLSSHQRDRIMAHLNDVNGRHSAQEVQLAKQLIQEVSSAQDILSVQKISKRTKAQVIDVLKTTLDILYTEMTPSTAANNLVSRLYRVITEEEHNALNSGKLLVYDNDPDGNKRD
jgi:hypothetical protein